jgi:hypothetical protein
MCSSPADSPILVLVTAHIVGSVGLGNAHADTPLRGQLATIEQKLALLFLYDSATAQEVVQALRKMAAKSPQRHEGLMVLPGVPGRSRSAG